VFIEVRYKETVRHMLLDLTLILTMWWALALGPRMASLKMHLSIG
jgi:hypothetical protein